ncbi:MAG: efflux RND transporter periplasmic adaptor subunit [Comamonadaceae bacterium]|nr:efflux RND transporter periplasmic adaptor subunit [Comamonadaceae bacterium]
MREGDAVGKGQAVLNLGRREGATALVASLNEDLKKENDNLASTRRLVETGALAGEQLDIAAANAIRVRAQLAKARETTQDYAVVAPWAGVVSKLKVRDGDFVAPRAPLAEIYDPNSLIVRVSVPEQEAAHLALGMKAEVELDAYPGKHFAAGITRLYPYLDNRTRTRTAEFTLTDAPKLLPGMFARAHLVKETIADAISVPAYSLVAAPGGGFAAFVAKDGKALRRKVETGIEADGRVRIVSGLAAGDKLIVAGQEKLKDGAAVKAVEVDGKKAGEATQPATGAAPSQAAQP